MEADSIPFGPNNLCRNGCGQIVELCSRCQHYCLVCSSTPLGLPQPYFVITAALQRRRRLVRRLLRLHFCRPPPCVIELILDHLLNDVGDVAASRRWGLCLDEIPCFGLNARHAQNTKNDRCSVHACTIVAFHVSFHASVLCLSDFSSSCGHLVLAMPDYYDSAALIEYWNRHIGRRFAGCNRVRCRPQPTFFGHCCAGCREGEESA